MDIPAHCVAQILGLDVGLGWRNAMGHIGGGGYISDDHRFLKGFFRLKVNAPFRCRASETVNDLLAHFHFAERIIRIWGTELVG